MRSEQSAGIDKPTLVLLAQLLSLAVSALLPFLSHHSHREYLLFGIQEPLARKRVRGFELMLMTAELTGADSQVRARIPSILDTHGGTLMRYQEFALQQCKVTQPHQYIERHRIGSAPSHSRKN